MNNRFSNERNKASYKALVRAVEEWKIYKINQLTYREATDDYISPAKTIITGPAVRKYKQKKHIDYLTGQKTFKIPSLVRPRVAM